MHRCLMRSILDSLTCLALIVLVARCDATIGAEVDLADAASNRTTPAATAGDAPTPKRPGRLILEDPTKPLDPRRQRTEAEEDRIEAISLFAAGRMLHQQQKHAEALRLYQRALRYDPKSAAIVRAIVPLAYRLKRHAEAVRYALKMAELEDVDPLLLRRLGVYLTDKGDWAGAVKLYEKAIRARSGAKETAADVLLRMEMGRLYHLVEDYDQAAECFDRVLHAIDRPKEFGIDDKVKRVLLGEEGATYALFGECYLHANRLGKAEAVLKKSHEVSPNKGRLHFRLAQVEKLRGNPEKALENLQVSLDERLATEGTVPYELLVELLEALGRSEELLPRLQEVYDHDPANVPLRYFLAGQYLEAEKFDKAELLYLAAVKKSPTLTGYRSLIEIYRKTDRPVGLLMTIGEAVEKTGMLETLGKEAETISGDARLMGTLIESARRKYESKPDELDYGVRLAMALLAIESKRIEVGAEFFELALEADPEKAAETLLAWGISLLLNEHETEAAEVFQRGIDERALPDDNPAFYFYLAGALAMDERHDEALAAAAKAVKVKEDSARFHGRVCWVLYHAKRLEKATGAYRKLVEKFDADHKSSETRQVLRDARLVLSNLCVLRDDLVEAEELLEQVLDEFPDDVGAANDLGYLWADQNKHLQRALKMVRHAVDAEPDNAAYRDSLGWVYYRLGRYEEAVAELEKASAGDKDDPDAVIFDHLGDAYLKVKQIDKAKDAWQRAVEAFKKQEEPEKAKAVRQKIKQN